MLPDGFGNFWVVDVDPETGVWGAVFFACHDPSVIVVQAPDLATFLQQLLDPKAAGALDLVQDRELSIYATRFMASSNARSCTDNHRHARAVSRLHLPRSGAICSNQPGLRRLSRGLDLDAGEA